MAVRRIQGILARNDWNFYESSCAVCSIFASLPMGFPGVALLNNSTAGESLDLYRAVIDLATAYPVDWAWASPTVNFVSVVGPDISVYSANIIQQQPTGKGFAWSGSTVGLTGIVQARRSAVSFDVVELKSGGPFLTLPPGYALTCTVSSLAPVAVSASVWYQVMQDSTLLAT